MSVPETHDSENLPTEIMELQMGPSHPATHGTIKFNLKLEGEKVLDCDVEVGYLHRGFAKSCENVTWTQVIPYTDRLNYASPLINNVGYALAVEKLIGVETPPRCQYIRVIVSELSRIFDHLTCCGMCCSELGAITVGFYMIEAREMITRIVEALTGRPLNGHLRPRRRGQARPAGRILPRKSSAPLRSFAGCWTIATDFCRATVSLSIGCPISV